MLYSCRQFLKRIAILGVLPFLFSCSHEEKPSQSQFPEVPWIQVRKADVPVFQEFVGQTMGQADIDIQTRVDGICMGIHFREGSYVNKGQLLYSIDPQPYEGKVEQVRGQLAEAKSYLANADADLKRIKPLAEMNAVSKRELDAAVAKFEAAKARVSSATALLSNQQLELGYCKITAPIDGIIGISKIKEGDYVSRLSSKSILNTISQLKTVRVRFSVSESAFLKYREQMKNSGIDAPENRKIETELLLSDGSTYKHKGFINFADRGIDPTTGTLTIESEFPNPENELRPGQFVRVKLISATLKDAMIIPQRAVSEIQGIYQVNIIDNADKIQIKIVTAGLKFGNDWVIEKGLEGTERIALLGNQFIRNNTLVKPVSAKAQTPESGKN